MPGLHFLAGAMGGIVGAAVVVFAIYKGAEGNDALAFAGSIIGAAVTGSSILAAWLLGREQIETQQETARWSALQEFNKQISGEMPGLMVARNFLILLQNDFADAKRQPEDLISLIAVRRFGLHHSAVMANAANAVDAILPEAPNDIRSKISGLLIDCNFASNAAALRVAKIAAGEGAQSEQEVAAFLRNAEQKSENILNETMVRIGEIEELDNLTKIRRAELVANMRNAKPKVKS